MVDAFQPLKKFNTDAFILVKQKKHPNLNNKINSKL